MVYLAMVVVPGTFGGGGHGRGNEDKTNGDSEHHQA